jgi:hypothetical protein
MTKQAEQRQRKLQELDERLQRWQREHPIQAWAVALGIAAIFLVVGWLLVKLLPEKPASEFSVIIAPVSRAVRCQDAATVAPQWGQRCERRKQTADTPEKETKMKSNQPDFSIEGEGRFCTDYLLGLVAA